MKDSPSSDIQYEYSTAHDSTQSINKNTKLVGLLTMISRLLGFVRIGVLSAVFGASGNADVLNLVLSIPNNLRKLLAEGALQNSFMPTFAKTMKEEGSLTHSSKVLFLELIFWGGGFSVIIATILSYYATPIIDFLFDIEDDTLVLASNLFSQAIYFIFLITLVSILIGVLQLHKRFILPALIPALISIVTILTIVLLHTYFGIFSAVQGYLLGAVLQIIVLWISTRLLGYRILLYRKISEFFHSIRKRGLFSTHFIEVLKRYPSTALAVLVPVIGQQITFYFASTLSEGSPSALSYAIVFWQLPIGIFINAIISVHFAFLLHALHEHNKTQTTFCINNAIYNLNIVIIPISILFVFFSHAGVAIALQRGNMSPYATLLTARILQGYAIGLLPFGIYLLFQKILYAYQKPQLVLLYACVFTILDVILTYILIQTSLEVIGISIAFTITLLIVIPIMYIHISKITTISLSIRKYMKIYLIQCPLLVVCWIFSSYTKEYWIEGSNLRNILLFFVVSIVLLSIIIIGYRSIGINILTWNNTLQKKSDKEDYV